MRHASIALAITLFGWGVGCGTTVNQPCGTHGLTCGEGTVCDLTDPDGPICIDADGDLDGDGIPNNRDYCNHMPGGQFDEDIDGVGDECDRCPIAPPPANPDPDGDALDSPCDPDPSTPGDRVVQFSGFNGTSLPEGWTAGTAWRIQGGEAIVQAGATPEALTVPLPLVTSHTAVLARYRIDAIETSASENAAGVYAQDRRPAGTSTVSCAGSRSGGTDRLLLDTDTANAADDFATSLFDPAGLYRVAALLDGANAACALIADRETGAVQAGHSGNAMSEAGLTARGATVRFTYLLVVQRQ